MDKKRKQHYVWEHYLTAWAVNRQVSCLRNNKIFPTNTENVLQRRDFYRLSLLDIQTIDLIKKMLITTNNLNTYLIQLLIDDYFSVYAEIASKESELDTIDILMNNYIEDKHSEIESKAIIYMINLRNKNKSFYNEEISKVRFENFIMAQYLRTNKMRNNFLDRMSNPELIRKSENTSWENSLNGLKEAWPIFHMILSSVLAASFSLMNYKCVFLEISDESEFITGDQPIINTKAYEKEDMLDVKELEFYYPITNKLAILLTNKDLEDVINIKGKDVHEYNILIVKGSDKSVIATKKEILERYIK